MPDQFLSKRIAKLRTTKGVSARDMSLSIGQNENYINGIENGRTMPSMQGFFYICEYLKITPEEFFSEDVENPMELSYILSKLKTMSSEDLELVKSFIDRLAK